MHNDKTILENKTNHHRRLLAGLAATIMAAAGFAGDFLFPESFAATTTEASTALQEEDTTKPTGTIISPAPGNTVQLNTPITVTGTAFDDVEISKVEVRAVNLEDTKGTTYALATSSDGYASWTFTLTIPSESYENITVRITDTSGNQKWMTHRVQVTGTVPVTTTTT
ncbi:Ig-like domain-containing protein [Nitrososphaera viennensis]|uniref:Ig-like domain-containing protein n=1 Tax=Nitrososphaera viennensis TaxID=1034015 RepID=A0A977IBP6_9ARCH|nr:Ig-like domain-containing protein [Nitrososphaera viennensis]UVS68024.1 Ig-like domain-containing protein [Nitrososphaera viennensis]